MKKRNANGGTKSQGVDADAPLPLCNGIDHFENHLFLARASRAISWRSTSWETTDLDRNDFRGSFSRDGERERVSARAGSVCFLHVDDARKLLRSLAKQFDS